MKEYEGSVYIGVVGPDVIPTLEMISIMNIKRRDGDLVPTFHVGTKGYQARQWHINKFMESEHDFILLLDHDMNFPEDTLERLRSHKLSYVSGLYMRRRFSPIMPVWFQPFDGRFPYRPWLDEPERGKLHEIGASGWGCILIHREVIEKTREILHGEDEVLEDDMDVWPYDIDNPVLRPLTGKREVIGSDIRYPFYALHSGYQLYGDPDVRPSHILAYPLSPNDFQGVNSKHREEIESKLAEVRFDIGTTWTVMNRPDTNPALIHCVDPWKVPSGQSTAVVEDGEQ